MMTPTPSIPDGSLGSARPLGLVPSTPALSVPRVPLEPPPPPGTITKLYRYLFSSTVPSPILPVPLEVCLSLFPCGAVVHFQSTPSTYPVLVTVVAIDRADPDQLLYTVRRSDGVLIDTDSRCLHDIPNHPVVFVVNTAVLYSKHFSTPLPCMIHTADHPNYTLRTADDQLIHTVFKHISIDMNPHTSIPPSSCPLQFDSFSNHSSCAPSSVKFSREVTLLKLPVFLLHTKMLVSSTPLLLAMISDSGCGLSQRLSLSTSVFAQSLLTLAAVAPDILPSTFINFDVDTYDIAFDNCTSYCVTNDKRDFLFNDYIPANPASVPLHGVGGPSTPLAFGTVLWRFRDDDQLLHSVRIPHVAYLPSCPIRLCRPQALSRDVFADLDTNGTFITTYGAHSVLVFNHHKFERTIFHPPRSGIPILTCGPGFTTFRQFFDGPFIAIYGPSLHSMPRPSPTPPSSPFSPLLDPSGTSTDLSPPSSHSLVSTLDHSVHHLPAIVHPVVPLSPAQLELLRLHSRLGHMNFSVVQAMVKSGQIRSAVCDISTCLLPKCAACLYGKMRRKPWRTKHPPGSVIDSLMSFPFVLPAGPLRPGSASIDHFSCSEPGLVGHSKGLLILQSFRGGAVFIDTESMVSYVHLQTSLNAVQTLAGKHAFEREMAKYGRAIVSYRCDNGIFADNVFKAAIVASDQSITYCGVGGHHQNSLAENRIGVLCLNARAMLLHATLLWPEAVTSTLWPFSLCLSNDLCNLQPRPDGPCYLQRLSLSNILPSFTHYHPFGCPVVVLDDRLHSSGDSIPRWEQRCWVGVYLGSSKYHASSVPLVLNLATGHVTTPFHVVFDDDFSLVESLTRQQIPNHWADLYALRHVRLVTPAKLLDPTLGPQATVFDSTQRIAWQPIIDIGSRHFLTKPNPPTTPPENLIPLFAAPPKGAPLAHSEGASPVLSEGAPPDLSKGTAPADLSQVDPPAPPMQALRKVPVVPPLLAPSTSRYSRLRQPSLRQQDHISSLRPFGLAAFLSYPIHCASLAFTSVERIYDNLDHTINFLHPLSFLVSTPNSESLTFNQALAEPDAIDFLSAATIEIRDHESRGHWLKVPRTSMPKHHTPIPAVWSMKRKIRPDGSLVKHKARLCAGGHRQVFELNYWDTYSPVVQWATVRLLLIIAALENLHTRQVDFVLAFPQADLDVVIYMNLPQGFDEGPIPSVLLLKKNLYGLKQASMTWFDKRRSGLKDRGCHQSSVDCCCFIKSDFIFLVFVDDCLLFSRSADSVSSLILSLQSDFILTDEGDVSDYLGIHISKHPNGTIHLTQPALIQRILDLLGIRAGSKTHLTPVIHKGLLHSDIEGPLRKQLWNYRSAIGILNYIANSTRPDISFAVHQCARFCIDPKLSHEQAVKRIARYLAGTADKA